MKKWKKEVETNAEKKRNEWLDREQRTQTRIYLISWFIQVDVCEHFTSLGCFKWTKRLDLPLTQPLTLTWLSWARFFSFSAVVEFSVSLLLSLTSVALSLSSVVHKTIKRLSTKSLKAAKRYPTHCSIHRIITKIARNYLKKISS